MKHLCFCLVQALDAAVHWTAWLLQQQAMTASDLLPADTHSQSHAAMQLLELLNCCSSTEAEAFNVHGHEDVLKRITYHGLQWLQQV